MRQFNFGFGGTKSRAVAAGAGLFLSFLCGSAQAGFTLMADPVWMQAEHTGRPFAVNDFFVTGALGTFADIQPDTPSDVFIHLNDLLSYRYTLVGQVVAASADEVVYGGEYNIFIVLRPFDIPIADVSSGTFLLTAEFQTPTFANLTGTLTQDADQGGPDDPSLPDLSYGGHPMSFAGIYNETEIGVGGLLQGIFRQNAVPTPGACALLGLAGLGLAARRRR
jgi:hypothetical protein